jgi:hypothetical protein
MDAHQHLDQWRDVTRPRQRTPTRGLDQLANGRQPAWARGHDSNDV